MSADPDNVESSGHDNSVELNGSSIQSVSYIENSFVITEGQPYSLPPTISPDGHKWTITVNCGRSRSDEVAQSFNNAMGGSYREYSPKAEFDSTPKELNFYFGVTVTFSTTPSVSADLYLGQGHRGIRNNWWIGSSCLRYNDDTPQLAVPNASGPALSFSLTGGDSSFEIEFAAGAR